MHQDLNKFAIFFFFKNGFFKVGEVEEAAERRARNLQRRQHQMETEVGRDCRKTVKDKDKDKD